MRAQLDRDPEAMAQMFDDIAPGYDRANTVLTFGLERWWRVQTRAAISPTRGARILDAAAGTGTSTVHLARAGAEVTGVDISPGMIAIAKRRFRDVPRLTWALADATALPFADNTFDAVTMSFGLRNVQDVSAALTELHRVCRPGGRLVVCEFSHPSNPLIATGYGMFQRHLLPVLARLACRNTAPYAYLVESIGDWPAQRPLAQTIRAAGWSDVCWRDLTFGVVALHRARKASTA